MYCLLLLPNLNSNLEALLLLSVFSWTIGGLVLLLALATTQFMQITWSTFAGKRRKDLCGGNFVRSKCLIGLLLGWKIEHVNMIICWFRSPTPGIRGIKCCTHYDYAA